MSLQARAAAVRLLLLDVDGVLTDGTVIVHEDGSESKGFSIRDGSGIVYVQRAGVEVGFLSARQSAATSHRARQLKVSLVEQTSLDKLAVYERIIAERGLTDAAVAFMGDDLLDLPVLRRVGLSACPADAAAEVRERVDWIAPSPGGRGAVRDLSELLLRARGEWDALVRRSLEGRIA